MEENNQGFVGRVNELVQEFYANIKTYYDGSGFNSSYGDKYSNIYSTLIKVKGPDIVKASNLENYLNEWDRPGTYGGFVRSISINPAKPMDPPSFEDGSTPNNMGIFKSDIDVTYHPLRIKSEFAATTFQDQLKDAFMNEGELASLIVGVLQSIASGTNDTMFRAYKDLIYKFFKELGSLTGTPLLNTEIPADVNSTESAKEAVNAIRNASTSLMFSSSKFNSRGYLHAVPQERQRLYIKHTLANSIVDCLKLGNYTATADYANIARNLSGFLGIPVRMLDDLGGSQPYDASNNQLYPIFTESGAVSGAFAATAGGTTAVAVDQWKAPNDYSVRALLTEDDFGNVFNQKDGLNTQFYPRGGGYTNTFRYVDRLCAVKPQCHTIFFQ
jgi:hypothetical protein